MEIQDRWASLRTASGDELKSRLFALLQEASIESHEGDPDDPSILSLVPRLADLIASREELQSFSEVLSSMARAVGLWNYIDKKRADVRDRLVAEAVTAPELGGITFHREQIAALNVLLNGRNLVLSAPTSFGKSALIDALLASGKYRRVVIVLPTIALLDEFRRRLSARFGSTFDILMHHSDVQTKGREHVIFLGTQERLINRDDLQSLDLAVVDEFYKLDPARKDDRSLTLNAAVYHLLRNSRQFFFLGPNIENVHISSNNRWKFEFLRTRFSTVAVDTFDLKGVPDKGARLRSEVYKTTNWPALVFVSSPDKANKLATSLGSAGDKVGDGVALGRWMRENYGDKWPLASAVSAGIAVHHGRVPRALASRFVRLFNDGALPILVCTSTLIEGVNTAAKSVLIYDKAIARENFDFFTFSNIRGRAGRLGQHHVGQVFLFHSPPGQSEVDVSPPLFGDWDDAPDELVVHFGEDEVSAAISDRVADMSTRLNLTAAELKRLSSIGMDNLLAVKGRVRNALRAGRNLVWTGHGDYGNVQAVCEVLCEVWSARDFGVVSARQLALYLNQLRRHATIQGFFLWYSQSFRGEPAQFDNVFKFLRACEHSLPQYFGAVQIFCQKEGRRADYSLFIAEMMRWFRAECLKNLDEEGVPMQISERFLRSGDTARTLGRRLRELAQGGDKRLSAIETTWILDALPEPPQQLPTFQGL